MPAATAAKSFASGAESIAAHTQKALDHAQRVQKTNAYFNQILDEQAVARAAALEKQANGKGARGRLFGVPITVKDCLCVEGTLSRAGSKALDGYIPPFTATAVSRLLDEGAILIGRTAQDEFGFGSFSANTGVGFAPPKNPFDASRACGGSSGGSAGYTQAADFAHFSVAESTGGSIACPASFCGVYGLTPTYGKVSRFGLIDYANSLDKIGVTARTIDDAKLALDIMGGPDPRDPTSALSPAKPAPLPKKLRVGVIREFFGEQNQKGVEETVRDAIGALEHAGAEVREVSLPLAARYGVPAYYILAMTEASTNLAKYCGMRYGHHEKLEGTFDDYFTKVRTNAFGPEAKRRVILGTFARMAGYREAYYLKAAKARTLLIQEYQRAFKGVDVLASPAMPITAPKFSEIEKLTPAQNYAMDQYLSAPNIAGMPHLSVPAGKTSGLPVGLLLVADHFCEETLIDAARLLEESP